MNSRIPFTPQRSPAPSAQGESPPPVASSPVFQAQGASSRAASKDASQGSRAGKHTDDTSTHGGGTTYLSGWTYHQSHDQASVLFYVPSNTQRADLRVVFGDDWVVAGVKGCEPVVKAKLAGHINRFTSTFQLESLEQACGGKSSRLRASRSNSLDRHRGRRPSLSHRDAQSRADKTGPIPSSPCTTSTRSFQQVGHRPTSSHSALTTASNSSTTSLASSFEVVSGPRPSASFNLSSSVTFSDASAGSSQGRHSGAIARSVHDSSLQRDPRERVDSSSGGSSSSFEGEGSSSEGSSPAGDASVASLAASSTGSGANAQADGPSTSKTKAHSEEDEEEEAVPALLVSLYLDKLQPGIWQSLVVGPAPLQAGQDNVEGEDEEGRGSALSDALREALLDRGMAVESDEEESPQTRGTQGFGRPRADTGSASIATTIASDDSETILGMRPPLPSDQNASERASDGKGADLTRQKQQKFNLDAQSLAIIGLSVLRHGTAALIPSAAGTTHLCGTTTSAPPSPTFPQGQADPEEAFEYFVRSFHKADVPLAITNLVSHFLPLPMSAMCGAANAQESTQPRVTGSPDSPCQPTSPAHTGGAPQQQRQRYITALGGNKELARLYVAYSRLYLSSSWSPLALPYSSASGDGRCAVNNPFLTRSQRQDYLALASPGSEYPSVSGGRSGQDATALAQGSNRTNFVSPPASSSRASSVASSGHDRASSPGALASNHAEVCASSLTPAASMQNRICSALHQHVGPLAFLKEAARLDPNVLIASEDWEEARDLAEELAAAKQAADISNASSPGFERPGFGRSASQPRNDGFSSHRGRSASQRKDKRRGSRRDRDDRDSNATTLSFASSAALLSVCVAGSIAAVSIWRRMSAIQGQN